MNVEQWLPICGYENYYEISSSGNIRGKDREIKLENGKTRKLKGKYLSTFTNRQGYITVTLSKNGIAKMKYLHRLVGTAFIENPDSLPEINHLSGVKADCSVGNLCWSTHRDNIIHAYENDLTTNKGGTHPFAVGVIDNELGMQFDTVKEWAAARGVNYNTGRNILSGCNTSKVIDLTKIYKQLKMKMNND
ncbi:MAG: NUMOD4 motif-containing HNH endonuclease [Taibaiella sp.]|nr:NUMOD4 motif-containing HNH endonuclease [Taibaiella sp.]